MKSSLISDVADGILPVFAPLTVQQYHTMIASGILKEGQPVELIDGLLVRKDRRDNGGEIMTVGPRHASAVIRIGMLLDSLLSSIDCHIRSQQPVTLSGLDEPEPDVSVVRGSPENFRNHHPGPGEVLTVIEVADRSLAYDRQTKQRLYAVSGIPVYLIVNLPDNVVELYERPLPTQEKYENRTTWRPGDTLIVSIMDQEFPIDVGDML